MLDLTGKVALVTGLGQSDGEGWGIGAACAFQLAKQGAKIFGGNRSQQSAEVTRQRILAAGGTCDVVQTDVTSAASVQQLVESCMAQHGRIDILINNVGRSEPGCPATMSEAIWDSQIDINLKSVYLTCRFVLPIMEAQGCGAIVSIGSVAGLRYIGKAQIAYNTSKAAVLQFSKATAVMYARKGVRLNCVVPGLMDTPYTTQMAERYADGDYGKFKEQREGQVPMGFMGNAWDVANAVVFLVSEEARYITGQEIVVDGGITSSTGGV
jgi:NAD(P)-dependent dehydrogenase (short-subunit alcohol dehydrogenase family)